MEKRTIPVPLTDEELLDYGKEQAQLYMDVLRLENDRKAINDLIKPKKERINELNKCIDSGTEDREVEIEWHKDFIAGTKTLYNPYNGEVLAEKSLTEEDKQTSF